jgi:hypothetical protein
LVNAAKPGFFLNRRREKTGSGNPLPSSGEIAPPTVDPLRARRIDPTLIMQTGQ